MLVDLYYSFLIWFYKLFIFPIAMAKVVVWLLLAIVCILTYLFLKYMFKADKFEELYNASHKAAKANLRVKNIFEHEIKNLANLMDEITFPIWQRDKNFNIIYCNSKYCEVVGDIRENIIKKGNVELSREGRDSAVRALKTGQAQVFEQNIMINGNNVLCQMIEVPISHGNDSFSIKNGTIGFAFTLTELQNTRERLKSNLELQKRLLESLHSAVAIYGKNQRLEYFNQAFVDLWKLDSEWLKTSPAYGEILEMLREKRKLPEQVDFASFKKDNIRMFSDLINKKEDYYYLSNGRVVKVIIIPYQQRGLLFFYEDITEKLTLERSYNTLLSVQKHTLDNLNDAVVVFGEDGKLELYNPNFRNIWGFAEGFLNSEPHMSEIIEEMLNLCAPENRHIYKENFISAINSRDVSERKILRNDSIVLTEKFTPLPDGAILITYYDITDKENVERSVLAEKNAFAEADRIKTNFLSNVSYELRSPLTSIMGFSEMLLAGYKSKLDSKTSEYLSAILESSVRLKNLIDNIIDVSSFDAGFIVLSIRKVDIFEVINGILPAVKIAADKRNIFITVNVNKDISYINVDKLRIQQAIQAIFMCGIATGHENGEIELNVFKAGDQFCFEFKDNGDGIPPEDLPLIFDQFYKLQSDNSSSTGLGLYLAKKIIEMHNGEIIVESIYHKGSKFIVKIPELK